MSTQPPERAAGAATPPAEWPGPDWADSQEVWPAPGPQANGSSHGEAGHAANGWAPEAQWQAPDPWAPQDRHTAHEAWPPGGPPAGRDWTTQPPGSWPAPGQPGTVTASAGARTPGYPDEPASQGWPAGAWGTGGSWPDSTPGVGGYPPGGTAPGAGPTVPAQAGPEATEPAAASPPHPARGGDPRWAMIAYLTVPFFSFLVPLAVLLASRRPSRVRPHAVQALNAALTVLLYDISAAIMGAMLALDAPVVAVSVAGPLIAALWTVSLAHLVRAASAAGRGQEYRIPGWLCATLIR